MTKTVNTHAQFSTVIKIAEEELEIKLSIGPNLFDALSKETLKKALVEVSKSIKQQFSHYDAYDDDEDDNPYQNYESHLIRESDLEEATNSKMIRFAKTLTAMSYRCRAKFWRPPTTAKRNISPRDFRMVLKKLIDGKKCWRKARNGVPKMTVGERNTIMMGARFCRGDYLDRYE